MDLQEAIEKLNEAGFSPLDYQIYNDLSGSGRTSNSGRVSKIIYRLARKVEEIADDALQNDGGLSPHNAYVDALDRVIDELSYSDSLELSRYYGTRDFYDALQGDIENRINEE